MIQTIYLVTILFSAPVAFAAVPRQLAPRSAPSTQMFLEALKLPFENRVQVLKSHGPQSAPMLKRLAFDQQQTLEVRWRAITALPLVDKAIGRQAIESALKSNEWYLRNAAAVALPTLERDFALETSAQLVSDPALVVRTAAVQNLLRLGAKEKESLLWQKLNSRENFHNGESLWVRRHIVKALSELAAKGSEAKFVALLSDKDARLHPFALRGLERLTGQRLNPDRVGIQEHRRRWISWWQSQSSKSL